MFYIRLIFSKYFGILFLIKKCRRLDEPLNDSLNMKQTYELILSLFYTNISVSLVRPSVLRAGREIKDFQHGRTDGKKFSTDGDGRVRAARSTEDGSVLHGARKTDFRAARSTDAQAYQSGLNSSLLFWEFITIFYLYLPCELTIVIKSVRRFYRIVFILIT